jgi:signal transduction histidine kinase
MQKATRRIAKGDLNTRVHVPTGDELGSLALAINDLAADLRRYRDTRSEFFANISHELRTPITYLEGYASVLKQKMYDSEEEKDKYIDIIGQESQRITHLIHDLFELSKMEEGKISLNLEWIDLVEVVENVSDKLSLNAKEKKLDIQLEIEDEITLLYLDGLRMEQVLINLLDNAIRYTEQDHIHLRLYQRVWGSPLSRNSLNSRVGTLKFTAKKETVQRLPSH